MLFKSQQGLTLLEALLVFSIGSVIILMSIKFNSYRKFLADEAVLQHNVDQLFVAMAGYYRANCSANTSSNANTTLNPPLAGAGTTPTPAIVSIPIFTGSSSLESLGFLSSAEWVPSNSLVDSSGQEGGYVAQFNASTTTTPVVTACVVLTPGTACTPGSTPLPSTQAQAIVWRIQIAVKVNPAWNATELAASLGAMCQSSLAAGTSIQPVTPCSPGPTTAGGYLVWERLPSFPTHYGQSTFWSFMPILKQFNLQYTHDQNYELNNGNSTIQNYVCGE